MVASSRECRSSRDDPTRITWAVPLITLYLGISIDRVSASQFSLQCLYYNQPYHLTFDTDAKTVVFEGLANRAFPGKIKPISTERIEFEVKAESKPKSDLILNRNTQMVTWVGIPDRSTRPTLLNPCRETDLRDIINHYKGFGPYEEFYPPDDGK
jgi:hypothetical protein